ncbi:MAG: SDR family oxidoreductase [Planctomycetes bacterium]|nr:SDR family oxidoreductase [Planctomycetota bacterium]
MTGLNLPPDVYPPARYIEKVNLTTGELLDDPILPKQLLVSGHRDFHVVDIYARFLMSRAIEKTKDPETVLQRMRSVRSLGKKTVEVLAGVLGTKNTTGLGKALFGLKDKEYYFRFKKSAVAPDEARRRIAELRRVAIAQLAGACVEGRPALSVLLTGGTGFLGKEIIAQAADDDVVRELVVLIRPKEVRDRKTKQVTRVLSPAERGVDLLKELGLESHPHRDKYRFIDGDIEKPRLGVGDADFARLRTTLTHVIHCAASVSFDDPYEESFRANVLGALNALQFSLDIQESPGSRFVAHTSIETSYIHGRQTHGAAREDEILFPRNFYNNFYELTKAMGSIETDRFMLERGLRLTQLCPAIVVGDARTGNNRGDTKVINAPINTFGRAKMALEDKAGSWTERSKAKMIASLACIFPGNPSAEINLIPVDRVVRGILAALRRPESTGVRIHLANDNRLTSAQIRSIAHEEIEVDVKLAEPTLHRTVTLPLLTKALTSLNEPKLAGALGTLSQIFGGYSEWGQPVHEVGNDVEILGLPYPRPHAEHVFRMVCRHNRFVQSFGIIRDPLEIARRERLWSEVVARLEQSSGAHVGVMSAAAFRTALRAAIDPETFQPQA